MNENVIYNLIDELALEGEKGCTFEQLFEFVKDSILKSLRTNTLIRPISFDHKYNVYLWTHLRLIDQLIFTENEIPIDPATLTIQEMQLKSVLNPVVVKASKDAQEHSIFGSSKIDKKSLTDNQKILLNLIAKNRRNGIMQAEILEKLGMDPKTMFYHLKKLEGSDLIVKVSVYKGPGNHIKVYLKRFAPQRGEEEEKEEGSDFYRIENLQTDIIKHLTNAKNNIMSLQGLIKAMGFDSERQTRWARIKINKLHNSGVIEKVFAYAGTKKVSSVQLPKTFSIKVEDSVNDPDQDSVKDSVPIPGENSAPIQGKLTQPPLNNEENLFRDLPADYQFYLDVVAASEKGLVRQELVTKYPNIDPVSIQLFLENASSQPATNEHEKYCIYRSEELDGKNRLYRYFSSEGWKEFKNKFGKQVTERQVSTVIVPPVFVEPSSIDYIGQSYKILPSTKITSSRSKSKKRNNTEKGSVPNSSAKKLRTPSKQFIDTSNEISIPVIKRVTRKRGIQQENSSEPSQTSVETQEPKTKRVTHSKGDRVEESNKSLESSQPLDTNVELDNTQVIGSSVTSAELPQLPPSDPSPEPVRKRPSRRGTKITSYFQQKKHIEHEPIPIDQPETNVPEPISVEQPETNVPEFASAAQQEIYDPEEPTIRVLVSMNTQPSLEEASLSTEPQPISKRKLSHDTSLEEQPNTQINPAPVRPSKTKKARSTSSEINSTKLRRCKILLDMMEQHHIRELNSATWKEFNEIEMSMPGGQKMAIITFTKMAKQLHAEKKITVYVSAIQKLYGVTEIKTFLLHTSVSPESEEMKQFISGYGAERTISTNRGKHRQLKKVDIEALPPTVKPLKVEYHAAHYGWLKSKWARARRLHENLMQYYLNSDRNDRTIDMAEYTKHIPIKVVTCMCSNLPYSEKEFRDFLDDPNNVMVPLCQLPESIQSLIFLYKARIRSIVISLIRVLEALGVVESMHIGKPDEFKVAPKYILRQEAPIRDYAFKDRALVKTMPLQNVQDVNSFWDELYAFCIHPTRYRTKQDETELLESTNKDDPLCYIHQRRGWIVKAVLTQKQKELLDSFIDLKTKMIPSDSYVLRTHLAKETGLSTKRIREYYNGILGAFNKIQKRDERLMRKEQRRVAMMSDPTINDLMLASFESRKVDVAVPKTEEDGPFVRSTFVGSRKLRKLRVRVEPDVGRDRIDSGGSKRTLNNFSQEEKDLLIYSYCIMKIRAKDSKFFWNPITLLLTNRTKHQCRRVLNSLTFNNPDLVIKIENLKSKWERYYKEGLERKDIEDKDVWNTFSFDLRSYVEYFIQRMLEDERNMDIICKHPLPLRYEDLQKYYFIYRDKQHIVEAKKAADSQELSVNAFNDTIYDTSGVITRETVDDIFVELIKTLVKMLLITPDSLYDASKAFKVISQYPVNIIEKATEGLRSEGLIIKDRSRYDRIPGRAFNVSEKYLRLAEGVVPFGLIDTARSYYNTFLKNETMDLKKLNSGMVASLLDLASQKKITLYLKRKDLFLKSKESLYYPRRSAAKLRKIYVYRGLDLFIKRTGQLPAMEPIDKPEYLNAKITILDSTQTKAFLQNLEDVLTNYTYEAIKLYKESGGSLDDIMTHFGDKYDKKDICNAIYSLIRHEPPLVRIVGFKQLRYVTTEFCAPWFIQSCEDSTLLNPLMWNDVSGKVIESALDGCAKAVISHILMLPGISHANLLKKFEGFFSEYELYTLMRYLVDNQTVIARKVQRVGARKPSIFKKRPIASLSQPIDLMNNNEVTFYWLSNDYYLLK
ncbi:hypothetical protein BDF21DRAFT_73830 [Thamnidium elegans]|nr:hypothetical protein BDF21DRAFT_73830 [Thamnidium elegans]